MNQLLLWVVLNMALTFTSATDSTSVTVNDTGHGAIAGSFVTFSNAATGNLGLNSKLNNEFSITSITDANSYVITLSENADAALSSAGFSSLRSSSPASSASNNC